MRRSDDYATATIGDIQFYYGYEHTIDDVWCAYAELHDRKLLVMTQSDIDENSNIELHTTTEYLLTFIELFFNSRARMVNSYSNRLWS